MLPFKSEKPFFLGSRSGPRICRGSLPGGTSRDHAFQGSLPGTTHFRGHFQGPWMYGFTFRKHTYRGPSFSGPHAQGFSSRNHVHYRGSHSLHWSILTFFIGDISAISLVWCAGFKPVTTSVDTNPLSGRWNDCLTVIKRELERELVTHSYQILPHKIEWWFLWTNVYVQQKEIWRQIEIMYKRRPGYKACRGFFSNYCFGKAEYFHAWACLDLYGHLHIYFPSIKNKYWLFVIQKFSVIHFFIV